MPEPNSPSSAKLFRRNSPSAFHKFPILSASWLWIASSISVITSFIYGGSALSVSGIWSGLTFHVLSRSEYTPPATNGLLISSAPTSTLIPFTYIS